MNASASLITTHSLPVSHYLRPATLLRTLRDHRDLIRQLTWRNVLGKYRGSLLGLAWTFILPLVMLAIYTFVFGVVFQTRWNGIKSDSMLDVALTLYAALLVYAFFSETLSAALYLIIGNPNYVKKVVFPLEILPICTMGAAFVQLLTGLSVLLVCATVFAGKVSATLYLFPVVLVPLGMLTLGLSWLLASLGVYIRDIGQLIGIILQMLMFLSPIFYSLEAVPPGFRAVMYINPLTTLVQNARNTLLWGKTPDWMALGIVWLVSAAIMQVGYVWFMKTRRGFADVL